VDIFIFGPARSGSSWLQTMLAEHPQVASPPETELFSAFLGPMAESWRRHRALVRRAMGEGDDQMAYGLATVLTKEEFYALERQAYETVRTAVLSAKPGATRFLDKTPDHARHLRTIARVVPDSQWLFLVRDPRDTVRSLLEASREPWGHWAPCTVREATGLWLKNVRPPLERRDDPRMLTVRYEDLRTGTAEVERISKFLDLGDPGEWLRTPVDASPGARASTVLRGEAAVQGVNPYAANAFSYHDRRHRRPLTEAERAYIVARCRDEMESLGYPVDGTRPPLRLRRERAMKSLRDGARRADRAARRGWRRLRWPLSGDSR
jgi:hypothetical protein